MSSALPVPPYYSEDDFLALEESSPVRHEFLNGIVYNMAGGTEAQTIIAGNIFSSFLVQLRGKRCRPYGSELLARIEHDGDVRMYYPDVAVYCQPVVPEGRTKENPTVIVEVLSPSTEKYDRTEKRSAYLRVQSLQALLLVASESRSVTLWQRTDAGWTETQLAGSQDVIPLPAVEAELRLSDIYEGLEFA